MNYINENCNKCQLKVNLSLYLIKQHIIKSDGEMEAELREFLTLALYGGEWSASLSTWDKSLELARKKHEWSTVSLEVVHTGPNPGCPAHGQSLY